MNDNQNSIAFAEGRPSSRVLAQPGGKSSINFGCNPQPVTADPDSIKQGMQVSQKISAIYTPSPWEERREPSQPQCGVKSRPMTQEKRVESKGTTRNLKIPPGGHSSVSFF
mmetsp:Transcript_43190/g.84831  ORF Transcript_43190/g.84831 Transcript_43190/m.84831 type:complete len:111 (+) Transcript_43190:162-494(+)